MRWRLLHAAAAGPRSLGRLAGLLRRPGRRVEVPALTPRPGEARPVCRYARDTVAALAREVRAPVGDPGAVTLCRGTGVLFGHSMGGLAALLAALGGARPALLALYEPIVVALLDRGDPGDRAAFEWDAQIIAELAGAVAAGDPEAGVARFIEAWNEVRWAELPAAARADLVRSAAALAGESRGTSTMPLDRSALAALDVPVVVLLGERSPDISRRMCRRLAGALPRARLVEVEGAGHMGPVLCAAPVAAAIEQAVETVATGGPVSD